MPISEGVKQDLGKIIAKLKEDLSAIRTGRASTMLVENIQVDYYGSRVPLKQIAGICAPDARLIVIEPWAKENLKDIMAAISSANLGVNPISDGLAVKISFPQLNEEEREKMVKLMRDRIEKTKVSIRLLRDKKREEIKAEEKNKKIGKDEKFRLEKELQKIIDEVTGDIKNIGDEKEKEIMTV